MDSHQQDPQGPIFGPATQALGVERLEQFFAHHAMLHGQLLALNMAIHSTGARMRFTDEELAAIQQDARDMHQAATELAKWAIDLAGAWREQRIEVAGQ